MASHRPGWRLRPGGGGARPVAAGGGADGGSPRPSSSAIARTLLPRPASLLVGLAGALGTPVWSTASRALWSHMGPAVRQPGRPRAAQGQAGVGRTRPVLLASLLGAAYLVSAPFAIPAGGRGRVAAVRRQPRRFVPYAIVACPRAWRSRSRTRALFGTWLPPHLSAGDLTPGHAPWAIVGLWLGPSRGARAIPAVLFVGYASFRYPPREDAAAAALAGPGRDRRPHAPASANPL